MDEVKCDLLVIGGGTGGWRCAVTAAQQGFRVIVAEATILGGTCLNTGCIPTKAMLQAAHLFSQTKNLKEFGITATPKLNFKKLMQRVHDIIDEGQYHIQKGKKNIEQLTVLKGTAHFLDKQRVAIGETIIVPKKTLIATGAQTWIPPIKGLETIDYYTNVEVIAKMQKLPKSITIVGGGYISMEFATFFARLGCKVNVVEFMPRILGILDEDVTDLLMKEYQAMGVKFYLNRSITEVKKSKLGVMTYFTDRDKPSNEKVTSEVILIATGRTPYTDGLDCEKAGIRLGKRHNVEVDEYLCTSNKNVYALGDCTGQAMFAHAAKRESHIVLENALHKQKLKMDFDHVPWAVFTDPPVAGVGMLTRDIEAKKIEYDVFTASFTRAGRARVNGDTRGFVKVYCDKRTRQILSCCIIGDRADDMIHEFAAVINSGTPTIDVIRKTIHVHPTLSEVMESLH